MRTKSFLLWAAILLCLAMSAVLIADGVALAGSEPTYSSWVMCQPDSRVCIRSGPDVSCDVVGYGYPMDELTCDRVTKSGWVHVIEPPCDAADGYIYVGYLTIEKPVETVGMMRVDANGRVAVRSHMCGERIMWVRPGVEVEVYQLAEGWAVTSVGFIRAKYLEAI